MSHNKAISFTVTHYQRPLSALMIGWLQVGEPEKFYVRSYAQEIGHGMQINLRNTIYNDVAGWISGSQSARFHSMIPPCTFALEMKDWKVVVAVGCLQWKIFDAGSLIAFLPTPIQEVE